MIYFYKIVYFTVHNHLFHAKLVHWVFNIYKLFPFSPSISSAFLSYLTSFPKDTFLYQNVVQERYIQTDAFLSFFFFGGGGGGGVSYRDDSVTYVLICFPYSKVPKSNFAPSLD